MCCALNPGEALRESKYRELVREMQAEGNATGEVKEVKSQVGKMNGLRLTLDLHSNSVSFGSLEHDYNAFNVFIGQRAEFPILKEKSIQLQPGQEVMLMRCLKFSLGHEHFIDLSATVVSAKDIQQINPVDRKCYFRNEGRLTFYDEYTFTNCRLECAILEVQRKLSCVPWFLPKVQIMSLVTGLSFTQTLSYFPPGVKLNNLRSLDST